MNSSRAWKPISHAELKMLFAGTTRPYWIAGGWAIDLFLGRETRTHDDLDVAIRRADQLEFQQVLEGWDLQVCEPPGGGQFNAWAKGRSLEPPVHNIWAAQS